MKFMSICFSRIDIYLTDRCPAQNRDICKNLNGFEFTLHYHEFHNILLLSSKFTVHDTTNNFLSLNALHYVLQLVARSAFTNAENVALMGQICSYGI